MKKIVVSQFVVLLLGTLFAWANFSYELYNFLNNKPCDIGCLASPEVVNPFLTPCFYGALFFLIAFVHSVLLLKKVKK